MSAPRPDAPAAPVRYAVIGHPVAHSLSPPMQRAAFAAVGILATYEAIDVPPDALAETLARLHREGYEGLNLTAPHKERARACLVAESDEARRLGAVNTLRRDARGWLGHATDGLGFASWAREAGVPLRGAAVALLGAGGAARAIAPYLPSLGAASIVVAARSEERAESIARAAAGEGVAAWRASALARAPGPGSIGILLRAVAPPDPVEGEDAWWDAIAPGGVAIDLHYGALAAPARAAGAARGITVHDGLGMLLHQGALAFTQWTDRPAPLEAMRAALREASG